MRASWIQLESAVEEYVDGKNVDWTTASRRASGNVEMAAIESLRVVASISEFDADQRHIQTVPIDEGEELAERWGELRLLDKLGRGSTADVYRVKDSNLKMELALKLPRRDQIDEGEHRRMIDEARALARVNHPSVVRVYRVEEHEGRAGIVMECVRGKTLDVVVERGGALSEDVTIQYGRTVAEALAAIHNSGLIHRDVKAQNVVVAEGGRLVLMDLGCGIQRTLAEDRLGDWSLEGTPYYMAPEVLAGESASFRSDVYSLGVLLFYLATGDFPVHGRTMEALRNNHARPRQKTLLDLRPDLSSDFVAVVETALHRDASRRYSSAGQLAAALVELQRGRIGPEPDPIPTPKRRLGGRLAAAVGLLALVGWAIYQSVGAPAPLDVNLSLYRHRGTDRERIVSGDSVVPGDNLVLELQTNRPAFVYILSQDLAGVASLLFPSPAGELRNPLNEDELQRLPGIIAGIDRGWQIGPGAGTERILIVASAERLPAMEQLIAGVPAVGDAAAAYAEVPEKALVELRGIVDLGELPANTTTSFDGLFERAKELVGEQRGLLMRSFELNNRG